MNEQDMGKSSEQEGVVRDLSSAQPFRQAAREYLSAGWFPFPLQPRRKEPWASGVTGRKNKFPEDESLQVGEWLGEAPPRANIGLWLREDIIGIDVDHYDEKRGGDTLTDLEHRLGKLPKTWISSARADRVSGIRFFRIPAIIELKMEHGQAQMVQCAGKLSWSGKAGEGIDIVQTGHRYAGVWPSWNPDAGRSYQWYPPGQEPNGRPDRWFSVQHIPGVQGIAGGVGRVRFGGLIELPSVEDLPELPLAWIRYLTRDFVERTERAIDMESDGPEIEAWAKKTFRRAYRDIDGKLTFCRALQKYLDGAIEAVNDSSSLHDKLIAGHWAILSCGIEGHAGALIAAKRFERACLKRAGDLDKREPKEVNGELYRSRIEALRKLKGGVEIDGQTFQTICGCPDPTVLLDDVADSGPVPTGSAQDPDKYELTDDGNAKHLQDLFRGDLIWVDGYEKWMFWNGSQWLRDDPHLARNCWRKVQKRQRNYARSLLAKVEEAMISGDETAMKNAKKKASRWETWADKSGNNHGAENALKAARANEDMSVNGSLLDTNHRLLGVANGIVELRPDGYTLRKAEKSDLVTLNTNTPFLYASDLAKAGGTVALGRKMWTDYLNLFLPDMELRRFVQKVMGYCLLGVNSERLGIFLVGSTTTGKTTMLSAVMSAMGNYASSVDLSLFAESRGGANPELIDVLARRVITATEAASANISAEVFKSMTGNDEKKGRPLYSNNFIARKPAFVPLIATNSPPKMPGADAALKKRLLIIPFRHQASKREDRITATDDISLYSREAVLHWLVEGWAIYASEGLDPANWPVVVKGEVHDFVGDLSYELGFIHDCLRHLEPIKGKNHYEQSLHLKDVFEAYQDWIIANGGDPARRKDMNEFRKDLAKNGFPLLPVTPPKEIQNERTAMGLKSGLRMIKFAELISENLVRGKFDSRRA